MVHLIILLAWILSEVICFVYYFIKFSKISEQREDIRTQMMDRVLQRQQWTIISKWIISSIALFILAIAIAVGV